MLSLILADEIFLYGAVKIKLPRSDLVYCHLLFSGIAGSSSAALRSSEVTVDH